MYNRADAAAGDGLDAQLCHELVIARRDAHAVDLGDDTLAGDLLDIRHAVTVYLLAVGAAQALAYRMGGSALGKCRILYELLILNGTVVDAADLEHALSECAGLVEHHRLYLRHSLKVVRTFYENALVARSADAGKEAERDADDQSAGAADDKEGERAVDPCAPLAAHAHDEANDRRQHRECQSAVADDRGIDAGKAGDEALRAGLARTGAFDKLKDLGDGGFAEGLARPYLEDARHVDAAAYDLIADGDVARQALARQGAGVEAGGAFNDGTVNRNLLTGLDDDDAADLDLVRIDALKLAVLFDIRVVGADVHQGADVAAALADGVALEQLAYLVEQHDRDGLAKIGAALIHGQRDGTDSSDGHKEVFIKDLLVENALEGLAENVIADDYICREIQYHAEPCRETDKLDEDQQHRGNDNADQILFLLSVHGASPFG